MAGDKTGLRAWIGTIAVCFLATILEGFDIQSVGVAGPKLTAEFALSSSQSGLLFSAGPLGLFFGAAVGGWLGDRFSRRGALAASIALFGVFSLAMIAAPDPNTLVLIRLLTGVGLGGAMPNLIALTADATPARWKRSVTTALWVGTPLGGMIAAQIAKDLPDWRAIFLVGGVGPILLAPLILFLAPRSPAVAEAPAEAGTKENLLGQLFARGRIASTLALWLAFFCTLLLLHLLLNWLPMLVAAQGHERSVAAAAAVWLNLGGCVGTVLFALAVAAAPPRYLIGGVYLGMVLSLLALARFGGEPAAILGMAFLSGAFVMSATFILYGLSPELYAAHLRGAGVGAAVAAGRAGSVVGPAAVGLLLASGLPAPAVLMQTLPLAILAGIGALYCFRKTQSSRKLAA